MVDNTDIQIKFLPLVGRQLYCWLNTSVEPESEMTQKWVRQFKEDYKVWDLFLRINWCFLG